jgi:hypothetical protein
MLAISDFPVLLAPSVNTVARETCATQLPVCVRLLQFQCAGRQVLKGAASFAYKCSWSLPSARTGKPLANLYQYVQIQSRIKGLNRRRILLVSECLHVSKKRGLCAGPNRFSI